MKNYFLPDYIYRNIYEIDFDSLKKKNIKGIIFDIDNTLVSYKHPLPTEEVNIFMQKLLSKGFRIGFISNNKSERVELFNKNFKFRIYPEAKKPSVREFINAINDFGLNHNEIAVIGDQLFTDVLAANRIKMTSILVSPIEPVETLFFKIKRLGEKPFIKYYHIKLKRKQKNKQE